MKKWKQIITLFMVFLLMITPASFAGAQEYDASAPTATPVPVQTPVPTQAPLADQVLIADKNGNAVTEFKTHLITTGTEADIQALNVYGIYLPATVKEQVVKVNMTNKGLLMLPVQYMGETNDRLYTSSYLYEDEACTKSVSLSSDGVSYSILSKGTYYLKVSVNDYNDVKPEGYTFNIGAAVVSSANQTLKHKTWICSALEDYKTPVYYKVTVSKTAKIVLDMESDYSRKVTLCNSKKKAVSEEVFNSGDEKVIFVVAKGTYYIKAASSSEYLRIKGTITALKDGSGTSKAKAKVLKVNGASASCNITANDKTSKADWFKFTNSKNQKINLYITSNISSGSFNVELYNSKGEKFASTVIYGGINQPNGYELYSYGGSFGYSRDKLSKGTYYIKITKASAKSSGTYSIKIKNK